MPNTRPSEPEELNHRVEAVRRFNRLYTARIGALQKSHLGSGFSLTEARILFELLQRPDMTATEICEALGLDQGYVSRILARFEKKGLILRHASASDGRVQTIALTKAGQKVYASLDSKAHAAIAELIRHKPEDQQRALVAAARTFERVLGEENETAPVVIRPPKPGDLGWVVYRHGVEISREFGWDIRFEAKVAEILGRFGHNPGREQGWIAERDGEFLGSVFVMPDDDKTARLRVLYVEPKTRGLGLGRQLVELCIAFARQAGYRRMVLWTHDFQKSARRIYQAAGFTLVSSEPANNFGMQVMSETWALELTPRST
jgi:DNA-binding MarR family transcriptional regulator/GNAT superfamily N-acetyltransferase